MNILFVVPYTPTPIRTRSYNLVRGLARRGYSVTLATLWENEQERAALDELDDGGICVIGMKLSKPRSIWNCLQALPTATPLQAVYCWQPQLMHKIISNFQFPTPHLDLIHVEHLRGARYGTTLQSFLSTSHGPLPTIFDSVDCISHLFEQASRTSSSPIKRIITRLELSRTRRYETCLLTQFSRVLVTSPIDKRALEELSSWFNVSGSNVQGPTPEFQPEACTLKPETITVLPNGVDLEHFAPSERPREPATLVFSGKMSYHANITAATCLLKDIMPRVWRHRPDVRVQIVGKDPPGSVARWSFGSENRVEVTGTVPDVRPYLQRATIAVAPMPYGAGIQNKVLEAMACATPVVATSQAASALHAREGKELVLADSPEHLAQQLLRLLDDPESRQRIGQSGRRYVEQYHDWNRMVDHLEGVYQEVIGNYAASSARVLESGIVA